MDPCGSCLDELIGCTVALLSRHFGYVIQYKRNISDLDSQIGSLVDRRSTVQAKVNASINDAGTTLPEVATWLQKVDQTIQEKETIFREESVSKAWCCNGFCPNLMTCHYLGRKAKKMTVDVQKLLHEGHFPSVGTFNPTGIVYEAGAFSGTSIPTKFESRISIFRHVMDALKDNTTNPVIIYGMSGLGKSTMLKEIRNSEEAKSLFGNNILLVEVSRSNDYLDKLQNEIADFLCLERLARFTNLDTREKLLSYRVKSESEGWKVLLILDDVCDPIDFGQVGIPLGDKRCKVLISTRLQDLYSEQTSKKTFTLNLLPMEEAWRLFKEMAGDSIELTKFSRIAEKVLGKCDGLPIAISAMGRALKDKKLNVWEDALRRLEKPAPGNISEEQIHKNFIPSIKFCYDCLQTGEAKSLFFLCSLYPEGRNIQVEDLVRHGLGLGLFANIDSMVEGRNCVESLIDKLRDRSLLLDSNRRGCVKMHDLIRRVALLIDSPSSDKLNNTTTLVRNRFFVSHGPKLIDGWIENCEATVAKPYNSSETLFLLLSSIDDSTSYPPEDKLKVLDFKSKKRLLMLPTLPKLRSIQTLRLENWDIGDASIIGELKTLMILSLRHSSMNELPLSFRNLSNLWLLDLTACRMSNPNIISSKIISSLDKLQELYMLVQQDEHDNSTAQEVNECYEVVSELLSWRCHLTTLEVNLPEVSPASLHNIQLFDKLERFKISIGCNSGTWNMAPSHNNCLGLNVDATSLAGSRINEELLKKTQSLDITIPVKYGECRDGLESIEFNDGNTLEGFVNTTLVQQCHWLPVLHSVTVESQKMLMSICNSQHSVQLFQELRCVKLHSYSLSFLFALSMARDLDQLEELDIRHCSNLKEIVATEGEGKVEKSEIFKLPNLIRLYLEDLKSFSGFSRVYIGTPLLINIQLVSLPKLIALYPNDSASESSSSATIQHLFDAKDESLLELRIVNVVRCHSVSSMFSSSSMQRLQNLEHLSVNNCLSLTTIFEVDDEAEHVSLKLSCMEELILSYLPVLEYIWKPLWEAEAFQSLRILKIVRCGRLKFVFPTYIAELLLNLEEIFVCYCESMEEIICKSNRRGDKKGKARTMEKVVFSRVKSLQLKELPSLIQFFGAPCMVQWPSLRRLVLEDLPKVKTPLTNHKDDVTNDTRFQSHVFNEENGSVLELRCVKVIRCHSISSMSSSNSIQSIQNLEDLNIENCQSLTTVFDLEERDIIANHVSAVLSRIQEMTLIRLPELKYIWKPSLKIQAFQNLKILKVSSCGKLRYVFPLHIAEGLIKLEEFCVNECSLMQEIICRNEKSRDQEDETTTTTKKVVFSQVKSLELTKMYSLRRFCGAPCIIEWPSLRQLVLADLCAVKRCFINQLSDVADTQRQSHVFNLKDGDFTELKKVQVIHCDSVSCLFPSSSILALQNLDHLSVDNCQLVKTLFDFEDSDVKASKQASLMLSCIELMHLPSLEQLWKAHTKVQAFQNLRILKIEDCERLKYAFQPHIAEGLVKLEEFSISECPKMKEVICGNGSTGDQEDETTRTNEVVFSKVRLLELKNLYSLECFCGAPCMVGWPSLTTLVLGDLRLKACFTNHSHDVADIQTYFFNEKDESLLQLRIVNVVRCHSFSSMFSSSFTQSLQNLEHLSVEDCQSLKSLFDFEDTNVRAAEPESSMLSCIEEMSLISLPQLEYVWKPPHRKIQAFQNLRVLKMKYCGELKYVFAPYTAVGLVSLEEFSVLGCYSMEEIVCGDEGNGDQEDETTMTNKVVFPRIKSLELKDLNSLVRFCGAPCIVGGRLFRQLVLKGLSGLKMFTNHTDDDAGVRSHVFNNKVESFSDLESLEVIQCSSISIMFSFYSVRCLQNLECLVVDECVSLRTVFYFRDVDIKAEHASIMLSCLKKIRLHYLPLLEHVWEPHREIRAFQNLRSLEINGCHTLKYVFPPYIAEGLVKLEEISVRQCESMEEIICGNKRSGDQEDGSEIQSKIVFPQLKSLELSELGSLVRVCGAPCIVKWRLLRRLVLKYLPKFINLSSDDVEGVQSYVFSEKVDCPSLKELVIRSFPCLKEIWSRQILHHFSELRDLCVEFCGQLLVVIPSHMQQRLQKLESLKVSKCLSAEDIFERRGRDVDEEEAASAISRTEGNAHPICGMDFNQTPSFQNLRQLEVTDCYSLRVLLSYSMAKGLVKLEKLSVSACLMIEKIVSEPAEGEEAEDNITILPQLTSLKRTILSKMTSSSGGKYDLHLPQLVKFEFGDCPRMRTFYSGSVHTPKLNEVVELRNNVGLDDRHYTINDPSNWDLNRLIHQLGY